MDKVFSIGSVVSIPTGLLLHNHNHLINDLKCNGRDHVYGVVMKYNPGYEYIISWSITGLYSITTPSTWSLPLYFRSFKR